MRNRWLLPLGLFVALLGVTALGVSLPVLDLVGSYLMVAAALALALLIGWKITH